MRGAAYNRTACDEYYPRNLSELAEAPVAVALFSLLASSSGASVLSSQNELLEGNL